MAQLYNEIFDVIVIGASNAGINFCNYIDSKTVNTKIALVSKHFNFLNNKNKLDNITYITDRSIMISFYKGLFSVSLASGEKVHGLNVVIATGSRPIKNDSIKNSNVVYKPTDIPNEIYSFAKNNQVVVYGEDNDAVNYALTLAKKFKYVYLCSPNIDLKCDYRLTKKLNNVANIVHLPNCHIASCKNGKDGKLCEVTLDTYSTITCSALVLALGQVPEVSGVTKKFLAVDEDGYAKVNYYGEAPGIPGLYAVGACTRQNTKRALYAAGNTLIINSKLKQK